MNVFALYGCALLVKSSAAATGHCCLPVTSLQHSLEVRLCENAIKTADRNMIELGEWC